MSGEETDPWELANLARGSLRGKQVQLAQAMEGSVKEHHRFLLLQQMALIEILEGQIAEFDQKIAERIEQDEEEQETKQPLSSQEQPKTTIEASSPSVVRQGFEGYAKALARLDGIPGINRRVAEIVLAEIGINMGQFPSDGHLASWAGMVRCITHLSIPGATGKNSKEYSWVNGLPRVERQQGQEHATESGRG